jgi:sn-glycerol 3-phosphate transport system permease protein
MRKTIGSYLMILPVLIFFIVFSYYPFVHAVIMSFYESNIATGDNPVFKGIGNYTEVLQDPLFWKSVKNNMLFAVGTVPTSVGLGLLFAVMVNKRVRFTTLYRTIFFYPHILPMIAAANIWLFLLNPQIGLIRQVTGLFHKSGWDPLGDVNAVLPVLMMVTVWKEVGFFMLLYMAALQQLPKDIFEAAQLDGASSWKSFWRITLPLLGPTTLFVSVIATVNSLQSVDQVYILTGGGPNNASIMLLYYVFQAAFQNWDIGMASTLTVILAAILSFIMILNYFVFDKKVHYN